MGSQTKLSVSNLALGEIGAQRLISFPTGSDTSASAKLIYLFYDVVRDEVLCEHPWSFATKDAVLTVLADTPVITTDGMRYVYTLPTDYLKIVALSDFYATFRIQAGAGYTGNPALVLLSDTPSLKIKYVFQNDTPSSYFPKFVTAFATKLASKVGFNLTESRNKAADLLERYAKMDLPSAQSEDSVQATMEQPAMTEWEAARFYSAGGVVAPPGSATWHFVFG